MTAPSHVATLRSIDSVTYTSARLVSCSRRPARSTKGRTILYRASAHDCGRCPIKLRCTPNMAFRKIPRDVHEDARDQARALTMTPEFAKSRDERKKVEMRFAHLKTHHRFERMRLRGLSGDATSS